MQYVIGIDGGASKTKTVLCDFNGTVLAQHQGMGCSYRQVGIENACVAMIDGIAPCLTDAGLDMSQISFICLGATFLHEDKDDTKIIIERLKSALGSTPFMAVNDSDISCIGSLGGKIGINVICGTGSGACGIDAHGNMVRAGGWHHFFSDEGSGYWLGRKTMELFSKQADGRVPKGPLYNIITHHFSLDYDFAFVEKMLSEIIPQARSVAKMQNFLQQAAIEGDQSAADIYPLAAQELLLMVSSVKNTLQLDAPFTVSYSGGVFEVGELLLSPFRQLVESIGGKLNVPLFEPAMGAVLMALKQLDN